jgi:hypothetical protein
MDVVYVTQKKENKKRLDEFQGKVQIPLYLSLPLYAISIFCICIGLFVVGNYFLGVFVTQNPTLLPFITTVRNPFSNQASLSAIRWKYYIPVPIFKNMLTHSLYMMGIGILCVCINKIGVHLYVQKKVKKVLAEKK